MRANSFLLSMCSPVLHKMMCGGFAESNEKKVKMMDVDMAAFAKVLDIWYGKEFCADIELDGVRELASVADRFQMTEVVSTLERTVLFHLNIFMCGEVLSWSGAHALQRSEEAAWKAAIGGFEALVKTEGFMQMDEETLGRLLDDDGLAVRNEEMVWEAVAEWRRAEDGQARGRGLVGKIRFPLMEEGYLRSLVVGMAPVEDAEWMEGVVAEALRAKAAREAGEREGFELELLGPKALDDRVRLGVKWWEYC